MDCTYSVIKAIHKVIHITIHVNVYECNSNIEETVGKAYGGRVEVCFDRSNHQRYVDRITRENQHSAYVPFEVNT